MVLSVRAQVLAAAVVAVSLASTTHAAGFVPGDLVVSTSTYHNVGQAATLTVGANLPDSKSGTTPYKANATGAYPSVFNNNTVDGSFGVTTAITLENFNLSGHSVDSTIAVDSTKVVTSFSSKSELAINLTADRTGLTFMGYYTPGATSQLGNLDISNSNTPGIAEPGNYVTAPASYRVVAQIDYTGALSTTNTNTYNGNNGRAAILTSSNTYLAVGNAGNGNGSTATTAATGVQLVTPGVNATPATPGTTKIGGFNITQLGYAADKTAKDDNYRGETIFNNTLYVTKGSGSNGINTVYQVGTAGGASAITAATASSTAINVLPGLPTGLAKPGDTTVYHPFGIWFANATTLYVADEGDGVLANVGTDASHPANPHTGLEKWVLTNGTWIEKYDLTAGLSLGVNYTVTGTLDGASGSYTTATDGLRQLTGKINGDGTVTIYATTSTVSNSGDQGADPNKLVAITDNLSYGTAAAASGELFTTLQTASYGQVLRGVAFAPIPEPASIGLLGIGAMAILTRRRKA